MQCAGKGERAMLRESIVQHNHLQWFLKNYSQSSESIRLDQVPDHSGPERHLIGCDKYDN